jgi:hypothetical protein
MSGARSPVLEALLRCLLVIVLTLSTVAGDQRYAGAQTLEPALSYDEALAQFDRLVVVVEDLRAQIDRTQFDLEELGLVLGFDAANVVAFVRDEIAFEQYPGLLRGAKGTLISRAGNALDQAVLLTTLLTYAGYETRIVRGELSPEQSQALIEQMAVPRKPQRPVGDVDAIRTILTEMGRVAGLSEEVVSEQVDQALDPPAITSTEPYRDATADTDFVLEMLRDAGVGLGDPNAVGEVMDEARDYFWVEYRLGPSDPWEASHPTFKDPAVAPDGLVAMEYLADPLAIPAELQHRFRFQVFIEQWVKGELIEHPVMSAWEAPVSDLVGVPVTFHNHLDGLSDAPDAFDLDAAIERTELFIPLVNDAFPFDLRVFDLTGTPTEFDEIAPNEYAATFDLGELIGTGPGGIDLFGTPDPGGGTFPALTAQWIDYTLIAPGGAETNHRRTIVDRIGTANREANRAEIADSGDDRAVKAALLRHHTFAVGAGELSPAFVLDQTLERFIALRPLLELGLQRSYYPGAPTHIPDTTLGPSSVWAGYLAVFPAFDQGARSTPDVVTYRHEPSLVVYQSGPAVGAADGELTVRSSIDVERNARRAFAITGDRLGQAAEHLVSTGVWETHAEALAIAGGPGADTFNTMAAFEQAAAASIPVLVVTSEDDLSSGALSLSPEAASNLHADLAKGYVVLVPQEMLTGEMTGWWRVNPRTGETLGMTSDGGGAAFAEYTLGTRIFLGSVFAYKAGVTCWAFALILGASPLTQAKVAFGCALDVFAFVFHGTAAFVVGMFVNFLLHVTPH